MCTENKKENSTCAENPLLPAAVSLVQSDVFVAPLVEFGGWNCFGCQKKFCPPARCHEARVGAVAVLSAQV